MVIRGNLAGIEYLLAQIYVQMIKNLDDPQAFLLENAQEIERKIRRPNAMTNEEQDAAYGTVRRVMETASMHFETVGQGPTIDLR
jgi:Tfp pilus assembly protein PilE